MLNKLLCWLTQANIHDGKVSYTLTILEDGTPIHIGLCRICKRVWTEKD